MGGSISVVCWAVNRNEVDEDEGWPLISDENGVPDDADDDDDDNDDDGDDDDDDDNGDDDDDNDEDDDDGEDDEGWPVVCDEDGVPEDSLDPLADGHCWAAVQAGGSEGRGK